MKKKTCVLLLFCALLLPAGEADKKYVWPLLFDNGISSSFQEFRSNHFHAGIDLRTYKKTGYPVRAIADGTIEKLIVSKTGIGRAVFLRHSDGRLSIYGHLERFRDHIEALVERERKKRSQKYFGEFFPPRPLFFKQGEIMAFSGESGYGFPHLHLEIRDAENGSLNPLAWIDPPLTDTMAPELKGILLRSCGDTLVNGEPGEFYLKLQGGHSSAAPAEALIVTGPFDLELHALDIAASGHAVAPYSLEVHLDEKPYYRISFDRLVRDDNNQLGMLYDMAYSSSSSFFYKLYSQSGFLLEKMREPFAYLFAGLAPGRHEIRIVVGDRQLNRATALIPIHKLPEAQAVFPGRTIDLTAGKGDVLPRCAMSFYVHRDDVIIMFKGFSRPAAWIQMKMTQGSQEQIIAARECVSGVYFRFKPPGSEMMVRLHWSLSDGRRVVEELQKDIQLIVLRSQTEARYRRGDFMADFAAKTVQEPTVLLLEDAPLQPDYPLLAGPVSVGPIHFTFLDTVHFRFRVPETTAQPEQLGIFKYQPGSGRWSYVATQKSPEDGFLGSRVLTGGIFALLRDIYPPQIHFRRGPKSRLENCQRLVVRLRDRGKGIDEQTLSIFLNGHGVESEYDPDWGHVLVEDTAFLQRGKNELQVQVSDLAGNHSVKKFHFHLR
jgi:hypothetical protein